jgi:hypothetical protein
MAVPGRPPTKTLKTHLPIVDQQYSRWRLRVGNRVWRHSVPGVRGAPFEFVGLGNISGTQWFSEVGLIANGSNSGIDALFGVGGRHMPY